MVSKAIPDTILPMIISPKCTILLTIPAITLSSLLWSLTHKIKRSLPNNQNNSQKNVKKQMSNKTSKKCL